MLIKDMDDDHLDKAMSLLREKLGPSLMLYEMGAILVADPLQLNYDDQARAWRQLWVMRKERERRTSGSLVTEE